MPNRVRLVLGGFVVVRVLEGWELLVHLALCLQVEQAVSPLCIHKACTFE